MKKLIPVLLIALFAFTTKGYSQFDQPSFQLGVGLGLPLDQMKGDNFLSTTTYNGFQVTQIDTSSFLRGNYGAKTGFSLFGKGKINFDKFNILRGVASVSFTSFNAFQPAQSGNYVFNYNNQVFLQPASYNYSLTATSIGLGLEVAPTAFTSVVSPYFSGMITFNNFAGQLNRTENSYDTTRFQYNGFRIGANMDAGIEFKINPQFGFALGFKYDFGNLLLREKASGNISERFDWGRTNGSLWDDGGNFYANLGNQNGGLYSSDKKNMNWGTVYIGVNIYPNAMGTKTGTNKKK